MAENFSDAFFKKFFVNNWGKELAVKLEQLGEPFKKAIRVLGDKPDHNPILSFMLQDFAKERLEDGTLNVLTFRAIYNAVAKNLVADSEFSQANDYNIIYCRDLYTKSAAEIEKYLEVQKLILKPSVRVYTAEDVVKNKLTFFDSYKVAELDLDKRAENVANLYKLYKEGKLQSSRLPSALSPKTILKSLALSKAVNIKLGGSSDEKENNKDSANGAKTSTALVSKLNHPAEIFAALQYIGTTKNSAEARRALKHEKFRKLSGETIAQATADIMPYLTVENIPKDIKALVAELLGKLEQQQ